MSEKERVDPRERKKLPPIGTPERDEIIRNRGYLLQHERGRVDPLRVFSRDRRRVPAERAQAKPRSEQAVRRPLPSAELNATDSAIELAAAHEIDLSGVTGSGAGGRITKKDVERLIPDEN
jgi:pyruvate/2-oxoglutarate dehydrogenase complex dihydrolipoamide acyltransferase (E2) component